MDNFCCSHRRLLTGGGGKGRAGVSASTRPASLLFLCRLSSSSVDPFTPVRGFLVLLDLSYFLICPRLSKLTVHDFSLRSWNLVLRNPAMQRPPVNSGHSGCLRDRKRLHILYATLWHLSRRILRVRDIRHSS